MAPVSWEQVERYFTLAFEATGHIERQDVIDLAFSENESDEVTDAIDALGSRVFPTVEAARAYLVSAGEITPA